MKIKKFLEEEFGFNFDSKNELKKKKLKKLLKKLKERKVEIEKLLSKRDINKETKKDLEEDLKIISFLREQKIGDLKNLIKKIKKEKK